MNDACTNTRAQLPGAACKPRKAEVTHARGNVAEAADGGCFSTVLMQRQKLLRPRNRVCVFARVGTTRTSTPRYCDPCVSITLKFRFPSFTTRQSTMDFRLPLFYVFNTNNDESFNEQSTRGAHTKRDNFYAPFCPSQLVPNFCFFDSWISFSTKIKCNDLFELYFRCNYGASNNYTTRHRMNRKFYIYIYL